MASVQIGKEVWLLASQGREVAEYGALLQERFFTVLTSVLRGEHGHRSLQVSGAGLLINHGLESAA